MKRIALTLALALISAPAAAQTETIAPSNLGDLKPPCREALRAVMKRTPDTQYLQRWVKDTALNDVAALDAFHQCRAYLRGVNDQRDGLALPPYDPD